MTELRQSTTVPNVSKTSALTSLPIPVSVMRSSPLCRRRRPDRRPLQLPRLLPETWYPQRMTEIREVLFLTDPEYAQLVNLLVDVVDGGAAISFLAPLSPAVAA